MPAKEQSTHKQLKFFQSESGNDAFWYVGSMTVVRYDVDYEKHAKAIGCFADYCVFCMIDGNYGYSFKGI